MEINNNLKEKKKNKKKNSSETKETTLKAKIDLTNNIKEINDYLLNSVKPHNKDKIKYYDYKVKKLIALESKNNNHESENNILNSAKNTITKDNDYIIML